MGIGENIGCNIGENTGSSGRSSLLMPPPPSANNYADGFTDHGDGTWSWYSSFESGTIDQLANNSVVNTGAGFAGADSTFQSTNPKFGTTHAKLNCPSSTNCSARMLTWPWTTQYGKQPGQGEELWVRVFVEISDPFDEAIVLPKGLRISTDVSTGFNIYPNDGFIHAEMWSSPPPNFLTDWFNLYGNKNPRSSGTTTTWECWEVYMYLHSTPGLAITRAWRDGVLWVNDSTIRNLPTSGSYVNEIKILGATSGTQTDPWHYYVDDVVITTRTPNSIDAAGNAFIGTGVGRTAAFVPELYSIDDLAAESLGTSWGPEQYNIYSPDANYEMITSAQGLTEVDNWPLDVSQKCLRFDAAISDNRFGCYLTHFPAKPVQNEEFAFYIEMYIPAAFTIWTSGVKKKIFRFRRYLADGSSNIGDFDFNYLGGQFVFDDTHQSNGSLDQQIFSAVSDVLVKDQRLEFIGIVKTSTVRTNCRVELYSKDPTNGVRTILDDVPTKSAFLQDGTETYEGMFLTGYMNGQAEITVGQSMYVNKFHTWNNRTNPIPRSGGIPLFY